jgi:hypothetical protein
MPPWHADPHIGAFGNSRGLTPEEADTLVRWIEGGAQRGTGPDPLPEASVRSTVEWRLGPPDLIVEAPEQEIPATGIVPYRYALGHLDVSKDVWVRGVEIQPSNHQVLHHSVILVKYPTELKNEEPEYIQGVGSYFALYIPGMEPRLFPEGTGKRIPAGSRVIFQFHYTTTGKPEIDRPRLALYLHDEPPPVVFESTSAIKWDFKIPPHEPRYEAVARKTFEHDVLLYDLIPHMHYRGRTMRFDAHLPDGTVETLLSIPSYDFNWQTAYELAEPRRLPAGTEVVCHALYDNSERNPFNPDPTAEVTWGPQSTDEMLIGYMNFHLAPVAPRD